VGHSKGKIKYFVMLPPKANPVPWMKLLLDEVDDLRYLDCKFYNQCLDYASGRQWESFTCLICEVWDETKQKGETNA
jgi:hypothetical protein